MAILCLFRRPNSLIAVKPLVEKGLLERVLQSGQAKWIATIGIYLMAVR